MMLKPSRSASRNAPALTGEPGAIDPVETHSIASAVRDNGDVRARGAQCRQSDSSLASPHSKVGGV
jgi:hypothetical protein